MARTGGTLRTRQNAELAAIVSKNRMTGETEYVMAMYSRAGRASSAIMTRAELIQWRDLFNEMLND